MFSLRNLFVAIISFVSIASISAQFIVLNPPTLAPPSHGGSTFISGGLGTFRVDGLVADFRKIFPWGSVNANFDADPKSGTDPLQVQFTDKSTGNVNGYLWNFGDGNFSNQKDPLHTYQAPGNYTVTLSVEGPLPWQSDSEQKDDFIEVTPASSTYFFEDFEGATPAWTLVNLTGPNLWHCSTATECSSSTKMAAFNYGATGTCDYDTGVATFAWFQSDNTFVTSDSSTKQINIDYIMDLESGDFVTVYLLNESTQGFQTVFTSGIGLINDGQPHSATFNFNWPIGDEGRIVLEFSSTSPGSGHEGFYIDNIEITDA